MKTWQDPCLRINSFHCQGWLVSWENTGKCFAHSWLVPWCWSAQHSSKHVKEYTHLSPSKCAMVLRPMSCSLALMKKRVCHVRMRRMKRLCLCDHPSWWIYSRQRGYDTALSVGDPNVQVVAIVFCIKVCLFMNPKTLILKILGSSAVLWYQDGEDPVMIGNQLERDHQNHHWSNGIYSRHVTEWCDECTNDAIGRSAEELL